MFTFVKSIEVVVMVVLGGMGSVSGSMLAAAVLTVVLEWLRGVDQYRMVVFSFLLIVLMLTRPSGLFGTREVWDLLAGPWRLRLPDGLVSETSLEGLEEPIQAILRGGITGRVLVRHSCSP